MSNLKSYWTTLSFLYNKYLYTKMTGFFLWLILSSMIFMSTTDGFFPQAPWADLVAYMFSAQVLGLIMPLVILFIPRLLLRVPLAFGFFDEKF